MKKLIFLAICGFGLTWSAEAQTIAKHALGLRIAEGNGVDTEVSYQHGLTENNRVELDLGWSSDDNFSAIRLIGLYQWIWALEGNFNWYLGAGGGLGTVDTSITDTEVYFLAAGHGGIEYDFDFPLILSLDLRPEFLLSDYFEDFKFSVGLGARYKF